MSRPDATAAAQLDERYVGPVWLAWLDFDSDPVRANSSGKDITITGSGDSEIDGTYVGISHEFVSISSVKVTEGGTETVTATLSGIPDLDDDALAAISDPANWRGRTARLWRIIRNEAGVQQGGVQGYYTGTMFGVRVNLGDETQQITVIIESYLAALTAPSNRTYDQEPFDAGDLSYRAAIAIANGTSSQGINPGGGGGSAPGGGGGRGLFEGGSLRNL